MLQPGQDNMVIDYIKRISGGVRCRAGELNSSTCRFRKGLCHDMSPHRALQVHEDDHASNLGDVHDADSPGLSRSSSPEAKIAVAQKIRCAAYQLVATGALECIL